MAAMIEFGVEGLIIRCLILINKVGHGQFTHNGKHYRFSSVAAKDKRLPPPIVLFFIWCLYC